MIKLKYSEINSQEFKSAITELSKSKEISNFQAAYNVAKIVRKYKKEFNTLSELYINLAKDCAAKDEKGELIMEGPAWKIDPDKKAFFEDRFKDLMSVEVEIEAHPISQEDLANVKIAPEHIAVLEPIFSISPQ